MHSSKLPFDGIGRRARNGLNFTERGFGVRGAVGVSDRGHTAISQLGPGEVDAGVPRLGRLRRTDLGLLGVVGVDPPLVVDDPRLQELPAPEREGVQGVPQQARAPDLHALSISRT